MIVLWKKKSGVKTGGNVMITFFSDFCQFCHLRRTPHSLEDHQSCKVIDQVSLVYVSWEIRIVVGHRETGNWFNVYICAFYISEVEKSEFCTFAYAQLCIEQFWNFVLLLVWKKSQHRFIKPTKIFWQKIGIISNNFDHNNGPESKGCLSGYLVLRKPSMASGEAARM
jgi:hypothetical protein